MDEESLAVKYFHVLLRDQLEISLDDVSASNDAK